MNEDSNAMFLVHGQAVEKKLADGVKVRLVEMSKEKPMPQVVVVPVGPWSLE